MKDTIKEKGILKYQEKEDIHPFGPVIRYNETDWEFMRRMAGCMGTVIYPVSNTTKPAIAIGILDKKAIVIESVLEEKRQIDRLKYLRGGKNNCILWELSSYQNLQLGSKISYYNDIWYIMGKKIRSSHSVVVFDYKLGKLHSNDLIRYGASLQGCSIRGKVLEVKNEKIKVVAVEPAASPVLSEGKGGAHKIQGIGAGFVPEVLNTSIYDEILAVENEDAFAVGKLIAKKEGILVGISSGAALSAAIQLAKRPENKGKTIVALLPDTGDRYYSTPLFTE